MSEIDAIKEQIAKTEVILAGSRENFEKNPESISFNARYRRGAGRNA